MGASVRVPATSANLGPGFDSFGLALDLHNVFSAELAENWLVEVAGEGADSLETGAKNRVAASMARVFSEVGRPDLAAHVVCDNRIPLGSGLGSSSAAIVGGVLLAQSLAEADLGPERLLEIAAEIEGHPDNVAAALFGGFTVCWQEEGPRCARFEPARGLAAVVVPATVELATERARAMLPRDVSHLDASFNVGHAGLLAAAIVSGRPELLGHALDDRLHEPYREAAVGDLAEVRAILHDAGAAGVALSGAGPTVIGLVAGETDEAAHDLALEVAERAAGPVRALGGRRSPTALRIDRNGALLT